MKLNLLSLCVELLLPSFLEIVAVFIFLFLHSQSFWMWSGFVIEAQNCTSVGYTWFLPYIDF